MHCAESGYFFRLILSHCLNGIGATRFFEPVLQIKLRSEQYEPKRNVIFDVVLSKNRLSLSILPKIASGN